MIVHNPGANGQAGSFSVNALLPLSYQNLGGGGSLTANGGGGTNDTLIYNGTASNDNFTIGIAGQINLNSRLVVNTAGIQTLTLNGFAGDDTFTLVPAISAKGYTTINLNGGDQASAGGDRVFLIGTAGADDIEISGQTIELGGKTINGSGIEDIRLNALDGDDRITYNGVDGVTENITVSSSGATGGGQISIPGVALVNFAGVERIRVNGSTPTPTETDTLTFAGTNAADTFNINLAAVGTIPIRSCGCSLAARSGSCSRTTPTSRRCACSGLTARTPSTSPRQQAQARAAICSSMAACLRARRSPPTT